MNRIDTEFQEPRAKSNANGDAIRNEPLAVASLVLGALAFLVLPVVGALGAIITGHLALGRIRAAAGRLGGAVQAKIGLALGYFQLAVATIGLVVVLPFLLMTARVAEHELHSATLTTYAPTPTPTAPQVSPGVKLPNEMGRTDYELARKVTADAPDEQILAYFNSGQGTPAEPELALLTDKRVAYLKEQHVTSIDLKDIEAIDNDEELRQKNLITFDSNMYRIEIKSQRGPRMRIAVRPKDDGPSLYLALKDAWTTAGGKPTGSK